MGNSILSAPAAHRGRAVAVLVLLALVAIAAAIRIPELTRQPIEHDEVYSYLAALGVLEQGQSVFAPTGLPYPRAFLHNALNATALGLFGADLAVARGLSVLASLIAIPVLYLVLRFWAGRVPSLVSCAILALSTWANYRAVSARMYPLFHLLFLFAVLAMLAVIRRPDRRAGWIGLMLAACAASAVHMLFLVTVPFIVAGLVWSIRGRIPGARIAGWIFAIGVAIALGTALESLAPLATLERQEIGTWHLSIGSPLRNVGLGFLQVLHERFAVIPWLALLAVPYAWARGSKTLGATALVFFASGIATTAGITPQSPQYMFHLFPLAVGLGCTALAFLVEDARAKVDTIGTWSRALDATVDRWRRRVPGIPDSITIAIALAVLMCLVALGGDLLFGRTRIDLGHDQIALLVGALVLVVWAISWRRWSRHRHWANHALRISVVGCLVLAVPGWSEWLGPYRYPPFQAEAFEFLRGSLSERDRVLTTEQLIPFVALPGVELGYLSQRRSPDGRCNTYASERDWVTGIPFVDSADKLDRWLSGERRTFVITEFRFDLHVCPELRERIQRAPVVYESDPAALRGTSPHPDWPGNTYEYRIYRVGADVVQAVGSTR